MPRFTRKPPFVKAILGIRDIAKMSQTQFAHALGFTLSYQNDIENQRRMPSVQYVEKLIDWLRRVGIEFDSADLHRMAARQHGWKI